MPARARLPMLPFFVGDYISATRHLSLTERGAYTDLLFFQWDHGVLPPEPERLARLIGCSDAEFSVVWPAICGKFEPVDGGLANTRLEQHRRKALQLSTTRAQVGSRGGSQTRENRRKLVANAGANATASAAPIDAAKVQHPSPSPNPSPDSGVLEDSDSRPLTRTRERPAYEGKEFHEQVIAAYHELLPELPAVKTWSTKRRQALNARIRERCKEGKPADTVEYWQKLFEMVATSDFLCGRSTDFRSDLEWLLRPENFAKVIEGRYTTRRVNGVAHAA